MFQKGHRQARRKNGSFWVKSCSSGDFIIIKVYEILTMAESTTNQWENLQKVPKHSFVDLKKK